MKNQGKEGEKHSIQRGNGVANDGLATIADLIVVSNKKLRELEETGSKDSILLKVSIVIASASLIVGVLSLFL